MEANAPITLLNPGLQERDKQMLQDVAHRLLAHGSLLRARASERQLYDWSIEHQEWLEEWAQLLGLKIILQRDERVLMAIPEVPSMTRRLRRDETLVALALWYDFDVEVRENGAHEVFLNVKDFNESFQSKFPAIQPLSASRLKEILRGFARFNLIETEWTEEFSDSVIQIMPTLRFAIPFPDIESWLKTANCFNDEGGDEPQETEENSAQADIGEEEETQNPEDQFKLNGAAPEEEIEEDQITIQFSESEENGEDASESTEAKLAAETDEAIINETPETETKAEQSEAPDEQSPVENEDEAEEEETLVENETASEADEEPKQD